LQLWICIVSFWHTFSSNVSEINILTYKKFQKIFFLGFFKFCFIIFKTKIERVVRPAQLQFLLLYIINKVEL
ncbi:hypothetical protein DR087_03565, partial [Mycoplasma hyopneumoniae]|nr:hypothetical protein [Mesomycoplasma hyopneumoniae]